MGPTLRFQGLGRTTSPTRRPATPLPPTEVMDIPTIQDLWLERELEYRDDLEDDSDHPKYDPAINKRVSIWRGQSVYLLSSLQIHVI